MCTPRGVTKKSGSLYLSRKMSKIIQKSQNVLCLYTFELHFNLEYSFNPNGKSNQKTLSTYIVGSFEVKQLV